MDSNPCVQSALFKNISHLHACSLADLKTSATFATRNEKMIHGVIVKVAHTFHLQYVVECRESHYAL